MVRRLTGNTATYHQSAFSGIIIGQRDMDDEVLVQYYYPSGEKTIYTKPVVKQLVFINDEESEGYGFEYDGVWYNLSDFMRDDYMNQINSLLAGN